MKELLSYMWRKLYKELIFLLAVLSVILIVFLDYIFWKFGIKTDNITISTKISSSIYILTFFVIFWYTRETYDLKIISNKTLKETRKQIALEMRPYIKVRWLDNDRTIEIMNIGRGIARQIEINLFSEVEVDGIKNYFDNLKCESISALASNESEEVSFYDRSSRLSIDNFTDEDYIFHVFPENNPYKVKITYIEMNPENKHEAVFISNWSYKNRFRMEKQ